MEADCECYDEAKGWYMLKKTEFAEIWQKSDGSPIPPIKVRIYYTILPTRVLIIFKNPRYDFEHTDAQRGQ